MRQPVLSKFDFETLQIFDLAFAWKLAGTQEPVYLSAVIRTKTVCSTFVRAR